MENLFSAAFFCVGIVLFTCKENSPAIEVTYSQTQCEDAWGREPSDEATITNLMAYLQKNDVTINDVRLVKEKDGVMCAACNCPTGQVFYGFVEKKDLPVIQKLGFKQK